MALAVFTAAAQDTPDAAGITVDLNGAVLLHRTGIRYPTAARQAAVQGLVTVEVTLDGAGNVSDARVVSGPNELRRAVLESVLQWHFWHATANGTRLITVRFELPEQQPEKPAPDFRSAVVVSLPAPAGPIGRTVARIEIRGLPQEARDDLLGRLPVRPGDVLTADAATNTGRVVREFDEHLGFGFSITPAGEAVVQILTPGAGETVPRVSTASPAGAIRVAAGFQQTKLRSAPPPAYPPLAKQARIQGVVKLDATISKEGAVRNLTVLSGHPLLVPAAVDAVKQWSYEPTVLNGAPTEVQSEIDVNFSLPPQ